MKINDRIQTPDNYKFIILDESAVIAMARESLCGKSGFVISEDSGNVMFNKCFEHLPGYRLMNDNEIRTHMMNDSGRKHMIADMIKRKAHDKKYGAIISEYHNLVPSVLRNSLATLVSGTTVTPTFKANYFALGTGSNTPADTDVALQTETLRAAFTNRSSYTNIAYLDVFFSAVQVGGNTYNEAGIFVDGSAGASTGYLLSRVNLNETLGSSQTLTVNCSITIS